ILIFVSYELPILVRQTEKRKFEVVDSPKAQASLIKDASLRSIALANVDGKAGKELQYYSSLGFPRSFSALFPEQVQNVVGCLHI
ncbi:unnamed protein product, partial [marine sediment metagenome]